MDVRAPKELLAQRKWQEVNESKSAHPTWLAYLPQNRCTLAHTLTYERTTLLSAYARFVLERGSSASLWLLSGSPRCRHRKLRRSAFDCWVRPPVAGHATHRHLQLPRSSPNRHTLRVKR